MQTDKTAPNGTESPPLVPARVRPNNRYGDARAGQVVHVTPAELKNAKHALVSLDAEKVAEEEAKNPPPPKNDPMFAAMRAQAQSAQAALRVSVEQRERAKYEPLIKDAIAAAMSAARAEIADEVRKAVAAALKK
jgi:hypothetical protein